MARGSLLPLAFCIVLASACESPRTRVGSKPTAVDLIARGQYSPTKASANPDNTKLERQLDEAGRATATAMGNALRQLKIPIGPVLTSLTYRALETVRFAQLPSPHVQAELGDGGQSMGGVTEVQSAWLKQQARERPRATNTILVTHLPNMAAAFPLETAGLSDGETLVFHADGAGGRTLVARIKIEQWSTLQP